MTASRPQQGSALIIVLVIIMVLASLAAFLVSDGFSKWRTADDLMEKTKALHMAEAGLDRAIAEINAERSGTLGTEANPVLWAGGSYFTVAVNGETDGVDNDADGLVDAADANDEKLYYTITSTGTGAGVLGAPDVRYQTVKQVVAVVRRDPLAGFTRAMFGDILVDLRGTVFTDSYDTDVGAYGSSNGRKGDVASNRQVMLNGTVDVWGNAQSGPGYVTNKGTAFVFGSTASLPTTVKLPPVVYNPPAGCLPASGASVANPISGSLTLSSGTYRCGEISLNGPKVITISGNVVLYVDDRMRFGNAEVKINPGCSLKIYQGGGDIDMAGNGRTNFYVAGAATPMGKPAQLQIFSASTGQIDLVGTADIAAVVYAPKATVNLRGTAAMYGSVIGYQIVNVGTPDFHYDEALGRLQIFANGPCAVKAWNETTR